VLSASHYIPAVPLILMVVIMIAISVGTWTNTARSQSESPLRTVHEITSMGLAPQLLEGGHWSVAVQAERCQDGDVCSRSRRADEAVL
jgi:hypothetical protein